MTRREKAALFTVCIFPFFTVWSASEMCGKTGAIFSVVFLILALSVILYVVSHG